jgi:redox-sensing transcriptional repressor
MKVVPGITSPYPGRPVLLRRTFRSWSTVATSQHRSAAERGIPEATIARLPIYHRALAGFAQRDVTTISSEELAAACGVSSAKLRKDLSYLGSYGTRGVGYDVAYLSYHISRALGTAQPWTVVIIGMGNLGQALMSYRGFVSRGFQIGALIDADDAIIGRTFVVQGKQLVVQPAETLRTAAAGAHIAVIAVPADAAQHVCDEVVAAGIRSILNFAPTVLSVPDGVEVRKVDLAVELQILAFHEQRRGDEAEVLPA